jgi:NAD(P)-dependent dehydrogenase (short-subunit alcohol dehydrogenase family)
MADTATKVALVTGAGSGIGRAAAIALSKDGFALVLAGRRLQPLEETSAMLAGDSIAISTDVGDPDSVAALFATLKRKFTRLDLLFNNAGVGTPNVPVEELSFVQWQAALGANLTGAFLCTQHAFRLMKAQDPRGGRILNNGSISATTPRPNTAPYTATKHAISGLTKSTALDGRAFNIACGQIDIGNAATDMTLKALEGLPQADGRILPEPRMDLNEAARAVAYMASLPLDANVLFMTVMATTMPFVGRG